MLGVGRGGGVLGVGRGGGVLGVGRGGGVIGVGRGGCAFWLWVMVFYATFTNWVRGRERWRCDRGRERWMCVLVMGYGVLCHFHQLG